MVACSILYALEFFTTSRYVSGLISSFWIPGLQDPRRKTSPSIPDQNHSSFVDGKRIGYEHHKTQVFGGVSIWVLNQKYVFLPKPTPQIIHLFIGVFHYKSSILGGFPPIFGNTHIIKLFVVDRFCTFDEG